MPGAWLWKQKSQITDIMIGLVFGEPSTVHDTKLKTVLKFGVRSDVALIVIPLTFADINQVKHIFNFGYNFLLFDRSY